MAISNRNVLSRDEKKKQLAQLIDKNKGLQGKSGTSRAPSPTQGKRDVKDAVPYAGGISKNSKALDYESKARDYDTSGFKLGAVKASPLTDENSRRQGLNYIINDNYRIANRGRYNQLDYLQDDEIKTVKHLISTADDDYSSAYDYLDSIENVLNERMTADQTRKAGDFARDNNLMGAAMSLITGMGKPLGYLGTLEQSIENFAEGKDELTDPNSPYFAAGNISDAYAQGVTDNKSDLAKFLIGNGLSMGNQLMTLPMGFASLPFMGLQGAGDAARDYAKKGIDTEKALLGATGKGAITYATERMFTNEQLFGLGDGARDVLTEGALKHIFKSALGEGVEEVEENVLGNVWDTALMGDKSDYNILKNQLMEQGLTEEEATLQAAKQLYLDNSIEGFLGGFFSGGVFGGMGSGANYIRASRMGRDYNSPDVAQALIDEGRDMGAGSAAGTIAERNMARLQQKGRLTDADVGKQLIANEQGKEQLQQEQEKINIRMRYNRMSGKDAGTDVVNSLQKIFSGGVLTNNEAEAIINDVSGRKMFSEKTGISIPENATMAQKRRAVKSFAERVASGKSQPVIIENQSAETDNGQPVVPAAVQTDDVQRINWPLNNVSVQQESGLKKQVVSDRAVRFGKSGRKAFSSAMKGRSGEALDGAMKEFELFYMAGSAGLGMDSVERRGNLDNSEAYAAYQSGMNDSEFSKAKYEKKAAVRNENAGFDYDGSVNIEAVTADNLDKVGKAMGVKITVVESLTDSQGNAVNGKYNSKTGEFVLSADNENGIEFVALHEMVHRLRQQDRKTFYELGKKVMGYMQTNNLLTGEVARQAQLYGLGKGDINYYDLLEEVVADFIGSEYDLQTVVGMFTDKPKSFVQKVIDLIDDIISSVKKALGMDVTVDRLEEISKALKDAVRAGTEKTAVTGEGDSVVRKSYAGTRADNAPDTFILADRMSDYAYTDEEIRKATGWFKGADGKWRFEIDDSQMQVNVNGKFHRNPDIRRYCQLLDEIYLGADENFDESNVDQRKLAELNSLDEALKGVDKTPKMLGDLISHPDLFNHYPELADLKVEFRELGPGHEGRLEINAGKIVLNKDLKSFYSISRGKLQRTLIHEIQHAIQTIEGFASGANSRYWEGKEKTADRQRATRTLRKVQSKYWEKYAEWPADFQNIADELYANESWLDNADETKYQELIEKAEEKYPDEIEEYFDLSWDLFKEHNYLKNINSDDYESTYSAYDNYRHTAGEQEARDVQSRLEYTTEQRQAEKPFTGDESTVFVEDVRFSKKDSAGHTLSAQQQRYFANSKVRDANGALMVVYHQTDADFTQFRTKSTGAGRYDHQMPDGIFTKPADNDIGLKGKKQMALYANITNPLMFDNRRQAEKFWKDNIDGYDEAVRQLALLDIEYHEKYEAADLLDDEMYKTLRQQLRDKKITREEFSEGLEKTETKKILKEWEEKGNRLRAQAKQLINDYVAASDYDGLIMENDQGSFGRRVKSIVAFSSEQLKNVSNRKPTGNPDIRYSKKQSDYTVHRPAVKELADRLIDEYSTKMGSRALTDKLAAALDYLQEGFGNPDFNYDTAISQIRDVAKTVVEKAVVASTEYRGEYLEVKDVIRKHPVYIDDRYRTDLASRMGMKDYGEFHKKYFGKLKLSKKGVHIDRMYSELNDMYPGLFPDTVTTPAEQMAKVAEVFDKVNITVNPYEGFENEIIDAITQEIYDAYFDMPSTKGETELSQLRSKLQVNKEKLKAANATIRQLKAQRKKLTKDLQYKTKMADYFEQQLVEEVRSNILVNEILDMATQYKSWYKGGRDASYLRHAALDNYIKELGKMKWRSDIRKASARKIMMVVEKFYTPDVLGQYYEQVVADQIRLVAGNMTLDDGNYNDDPLNLQELEAVANVMKAIKKLYQEFDTVRIDGRRENTRELARKEYDILDKYGRSDVKVKYFNYLANRLMTDGVYNAVESRVVYQALEGFHEDGVLKKLHDDMTAGVTKSNKLRIDMLKTRDEYLKNNPEYRKRLEQDTVKFYGVEMSVGQAITTYLTMHREEAQATLTSTALGSGLVIRDEKGRVAEIQALTDVQRAIDELGKLLTKEDKEFVRIARNIFNEEARSVKEQADMDVLGFTNVSESKNYIPIKRSGDQIAVAFSDVRQMVQDVASVYNFSFNKATVQHSEKAIEIFDINALLDNHCGKVAMYAGLTQPLQTFDRVLNANITVDGDGKKYGEMNLRDKLNKIWKPVQKGANKIGGFHQFHSNLMQDVQSRGRGDSSRLVNRVKSNFASAALGANLKEIISQPTGYLMAYQYLSGEAMAKGATMKNDYDSMMKYSDYAVVRDYDKGYLLSESLVDKVEGFAKWFGEPLDWADKFTMGKLWNACQVETELKQGLKIGTEENYRAAAELLEKVGRLTQPNYDASEKSALQRNKNEIISSFSMFSSVQTKQLSRTLESVTKYQMLKERAAKEPTDFNLKAAEDARTERKRCRAGILMMNAGYVFICVMVKAALPKKEEEKITDAMDLTKKMASGMMESYVGMIPFADDLANMFIDGYDTGHFFYSSINDMASAIRGMKNIDKDPGKVLYNLAVATGQLTGVPTRNISNVLKGAINRGASAMGTKGEYVGNKLVYSAFGGEKKSTYMNLLYNAMYDGDAETAKYIISDMKKRGYTEQSITTTLKTMFAEQAVEHWAEKDSEKLKKVLDAMKIAGLSQNSIKSQIRTRMKKYIVNDRAIVKLAAEISRYRNSSSDWKAKHKSDLQAKIDRLIAQYAEKGYNQSVVTAAIESLIE